MGGMARTSARSYLDTVPIPRAVLGGCYTPCQSPVLVTHCHLHRIALVCTIPAPFRTGTPVWYLSDGAFLLFTEGSEVRLMTVLF